MERKWYLDLWLLIRFPFKRGISEIVEFGTIQRGFASAIGMLVISLLVSWSIGLVESYSLGYSALPLGTVLGIMAGAGIFTVVFYALIAFAVLAIYSVIFSKIANKFGAHTNYESVLKICWYQSAYSMVISLVLSIVQAILVLIVNGINLDVYAPDIILYIISFSYMILQVVVYIWYFWVSLTLMARQIEKGRLSTFGIGILASLVPVVFIGILVGLVMLAVRM
ncbi:hypothetical protein [uncultured Veillonella sp.]|uniref:hypothetical protein n=1 Tax=uncultured Veillonella sp. TaxID=159268 RepID=UPI0028DBE265|nr:hypothetical protein [uncultured Veillonella sp.]